MVAGNPRVAWIESLGNGAWHLIFHHLVELDSVPDTTPGDNVAAAEWFRLEALPASSEVAHEGWALDVIGQLLEDRA